ncbi:MAG TPA: hypothetical protein VGB79_02405 [Allosphingosinicella sp.]|jgi:hypothetical protein
MLFPLLLAAAHAVQPDPNAATSPPPVANPQPPAIDVTASMVAYRDWRICLEAALATDGRRSARVRAEGAFETCSAQEQALSVATLAAFGPDGGADLMGRFSRDTRAELGAPPQPRR